MTPLSVVSRVGIWIVLVLCTAQQLLTNNNNGFSLAFSSTSILHVQVRGSTSTSRHQHQRSLQYTNTQLRLTTIKSNQQQRQHQRQRQSGRRQWQLHMSLEPLAKEGSWTAYLDEETTGLIYYFNTVTGESSWDPPTKTFPKVKISRWKEARMISKRKEYNQSVGVSDTTASTSTNTATSTSAGTGTGTGTSSSSQTTTTATADTNDESSMKNGFGGAGMFNAFFSPNKQEVESAKVVDEIIELEDVANNAKEGTPIFKFFGGSSSSSSSASSSSSSASKSTSSVEAEKTNINGSSTGKAAAGAAAEAAKPTIFDNWFGTQQIESAKSFFDTSASTTTKSKKSSGATAFNVNGGTNTNGETTSTTNTNTKTNGATTTTTTTTTNGATSTSTNGSTETGTAAAAAPGGFLNSLFGQVGTTSTTTNNNNKVNGNTATNDEEFYDQMMYEDAVLAEDEEPEVQQAPTPIKLEISSKILPHPEKVSWGGEDSLFVSGRSFGVFDGVSGAEKLDGVPLYSNTLAQQMKSSVGKGGLSIDEIKANMLKAAEYADVAATGASTAVVASIGDDDTLRAVNLGDSVLMVIREGKISARAKETIHYFDCPFQLSDESPDRPRNGSVLQTPLKKGDLIIAGSDGIFDNLSDDQICEIVSKNNKGSISKVAQQLVSESRKISKDPNAATPYARMAKRNNYSGYSMGVGGKLDDISCVVVRCK